MMMDWLLIWITEISAVVSYTGNSIGLSRSSRLSKELYRIPPYSITTA